MSARRIGGLVAVVTLLGSAAYFFVYLYRWEWNRAEVAGAIFLAAEVGVLGLLVSERLHRLERTLGHLAAAREERRRQVLREHAPAPRASFAWLSRPGRAPVFIPVLLGAGVVLSGVAWVVERLSQATVGRLGERDLGRRLGAIDPPHGGLLARDDDPLDLLRRAQR